MGSARSPVRRTLGKANTPKASTSLIINTIDFSLWFKLANPLGLTMHSHSDGSVIDLPLFALTKDSVSFGIAEFGHIII